MIEKSKYPNIYPIVENRIKWKYTLLLAPVLFAFGEDKKKKNEKR